MSYSNINDAFNINPHFENIVQNIEHFNITQDNNYSNENLSYNYPNFELFQTNQSNFHSHLY